MREFALRSGRGSTELPMDVKTDAGSFLAVLKNLGRGGLFIATDRRLEVGDRVGIRFTLPDLGGSISAVAEVRWISDGEARPSGLGVRFVNLPIDAEIAIRDLLRKQDEDLTPSGPSI